MEPLTHVLDKLRISQERVCILYKCGSVHVGRIIQLKDVYYLVFNIRAIVATRIDLDSIVSVRYSLSRLYLWKCLGSRSFLVKTKKRYENNNH